MIAHVFGKVVEKIGSDIIVDVHGVGYEVQVSTSDFDAVQLNEDVKFYTYHYLREQSEELFGFLTLMSKKLFELLITVQGIGPKAALAILSLGDSETVRNAIAASNGSFIAQASGVGAKTAERVVVDLSDKVGPLTLAQNLSGVGLTKSNDEALEALMSLGYNIKDASDALMNVSRDLSTEERIKQALKGKK